MRKKLKHILIILMICIATSYLFLNPIGALRFAVLRNGYPIEAITLKVNYSLCRKPVGMDKKNKIVYTISNPPIEEKTQTPFDSWVISKHGIFYWGELYLV